MRHRDFAAPLRAALGADMRKKRNPDGTYKFAHRVLNDPARWTATARDKKNKPVRLGTYDDAPAAALVRAAADRDPSLHDSKRRAAWLAAMRDAGAARAWVAEYARDGARAAGLAALRRSPSLRRWRAHVRHLPGNAAYRDALASWNAALR